MNRRITRYVRISKYQECIPISSNPNKICLNRFRILYNWKWRPFGCCLALYGKIDCCDSTSIPWIWNGFALYVLIVDRIIGRYIGPLFTTTNLIVVAAASALFLPYHSFIDSRLTKSITIFLVSKWNGVNESKESNKFCLVINDPSIYEWLIINGIKNKKCVVCDIGYCKVGEKDGGWWWFLFVDIGK